MMRNVISDERTIHETEDDVANSRYLLVFAFSFTQKIIFSFSFSALTFIKSNPGF